MTHLKRPWCWERLKAGEGYDRQWDGWMASPTWLTWVWPDSGSWWWTGKPGMLQSMGLRSQTQPNDWTEPVSCMKLYRLKGPQETWHSLCLSCVLTYQLPCCLHSTAQVRNQQERPPNHGLLFVNKVLLAHGYIHSLTCYLQLLRWQWQSWVIVLRRWTELNRDRG